VHGRCPQIQEKGGLSRWGRLVGYRSLRSGASYRVDCLIIDWKPTLFCRFVCPFLGASCSWTFVCVLLVWIIAFNPLLWSHRQPYWILRVYNTPSRNIIAIDRWATRIVGSIKSSGRSWYETNTYRRSSIMTVACSTSNPTFTDCQWSYLILTL